MFFFILWCPFETAMALSGLLIFRGHLFCHFQPKYSYFRRSLRLYTKDYKKFSLLVVVLMGGDEGIKGKRMFFFYKLYFTDAKYN